MDINKALRVEKKKNVRFYIYMCILAIVIPGSLWATSIIDSFFIGYAIIMELLIVLVILKRIDSFNLTYKYLNNKLTFKTGLFNKRNLILCDQVALIHTEGIEEDMKVIVISTVKFRNTKFKPVVEGLLRKYPNMRDEYKKVKNVNSDKVFYYLILKKGGLKKYTMLGDLFTYCAKSSYTTEAIQSIKISRGYTID